MTTIRIEKRSVTTLLENVRNGYEERYKREVGGFLLGYRGKRTFHVRRIVPYRTPRRSRTGWNPNMSNLERRGAALETRLLKWIGTYHSHVEVGGSASTGQSKIDRESHLVSGRPLEVIIRITEYKMKSPLDCLTLSKMMQNGTSYFFDICGYWKSGTGEIKRLRVRER